jgi:hypothetical protein
MPKHFLEDMVKAKRLSKGTTKEKEKKGEVREVKQVEVSHIKGGARHMLWIVAFISVAFFLFALSFLFGKAEVKVDPKMQDIVLNDNLSAGKDGDINGLPFNLVAIAGEESKTIQSTAQKDVAIDATGTVIIYNTFSPLPQALSMGTRLEGSNGKIYRTQIKVVVPGISKNRTPGSVEVGVYGTVAGEEYNSGPIDFKIFGFKGTPKYAKFYGRSKGEITGGFIGKAPDITDVEKASAENDLKNTLEMSLLKKATDQIPGGFVLFKDAVFLSTDDTNVPISSDGGNFTMTMKGTLYGLLFDGQKLAKKIAKDNIENYDGSDVFIPNIRDLIFTLANKDNISFGDVKNISFNLSGSAKIVWNLDVNKFTNDLLGKSRKEFDQILSQYPDVDSAVLTISPPWKMSIPDKAKDVKVIVNYPK